MRDRDVLFDHVIDLGLTGADEDEAVVEILALSRRNRGRVEHVLRRLSFLRSDEGVERAQTYLRAALAQGDDERFWHYR